LQGQVRVYSNHRLNSTTDATTFMLSARSTRAKTECFSGFGRTYIHDDRGHLAAGEGRPWLATQV